MNSTWVHDIYAGVILLDGKSTGHEQNLADFKPKDEPKIINN